MNKLQADLLVQSNDEFTRKEYRVGETDIYIYDYNYPKYSSFEDKNLRELRGLTITKENAQERVYLSVPKFFNADEVPETSMETLKYKKIKKIQEKLDGSLIQFIQINGDVIAKSKASLSSPQAVQAQKIVDESTELKYFLMDLWANDFHPIFELIGPYNKHVVDYPEDCLILVAVRSQEGEFIDVDKFNYKYTTKSYDIDTFTLDDIQEHCAMDKNTEGFVVKFTTGEIVKFKSAEYIQKHQVFKDADQCKNIFAHILNGTLDDTLSILSETRKKEIKEYQELLLSYIHHWTDFCLEVTRNNPDTEELNSKYERHMFHYVIMLSPGQTEDKIRENVIRFLKRRYEKETEVKDFFKLLKE